ncbi:MAG: XRE family transcriptional regulator [Albidovulum sp.]|nr:XRE family transcriptional regulator [Albidovulum sp.]
MIYSDKQYGISSGELTKLKSALAATEALLPNDDWVQELEIEGLKSQIAEIEADITHYRLLKAGEIGFTKSYSLNSLPSILIQARIASGMSQSDLAKSLGLKPQQVQRYEATEYMSASLARLIEVANHLNVHTVGLFETETDARGIVLSWDDIGDVNWQEFPAREMAKRRWFDMPLGANLIERAKAYFLEAAGPQFVNALHRKKIRCATLPNEYGLLAWQARILELARTIIEEERLPCFNFDDRWLPELTRLTRRTDGPRRARELLASKGIVLVTEKHMPGTYLDGAAMLSVSDRPVIGMTLRYDRLDNFWFVLFHELGHVYLHLFGGFRYDFFDDYGFAAKDRIELEADQFALNNLIPDDQWDKCSSRFALSEKAVRLDAKALGIDASIIAGRIRKELENYAILNELVGPRRVRAQFADETDDLE